jgi:hypothetical protein
VGSQDAKLLYEGCVFVVEPGETDRELEYQQHQEQHTQDEEQVRGISYAYLTGKPVEQVEGEGRTKENHRNAYPQPQYRRLFTQQSTVNGASSQPKEA